MLTPSFPSISQVAELTPAFINPLAAAKQHQCGHDCAHHDPVPQPVHNSLQTNAPTKPAQPSGLVKPPRPAATSVSKPAKPQVAAPIITNRPSPLPVAMAMDTSGMAVLLDAMDEEQRKAPADDSSHSNSASTTKRGQARKCPHGKRYVQGNGTNWSRSQSDTEI